MKPPPNVPITLVFVVQVVPIPDAKPHITFRVSADEVDVLPPARIGLLSVWIIPVPIQGSRNGIGVHHSILMFCEVVCGVCQYGAARFGLRKGD